MIIRGKKFSEYWNVMKIPFYVLLAYSIAGLVTAAVNLNAFLNIFGRWGGILLSMLVFGYAGWSAMVDHKFSLSHAAWTGALLGVISGLAGAVIGIIMLFLVPGIMDISVNQAAGVEGITPDTIRTFAIVGSFFSLVIGPVINGLIGAGMGVLGGLVGRKS